METIANLPFIGGIKSFLLIAHEQLKEEIESEKRPSTRYNLIQI